MFSRFLLPSPLDIVGCGAAPVATPRSKDTKIGRKPSKSHNTATQNLRPGGRTALLLHLATHLLESIELGLSDVLRLLRLQCVLVPLWLPASLCIRSGCLLPLFLWFPWCVLVPSGWLVSLAVARFPCLSGCPGVLRFALDAWFVVVSFRFGSWLLPPSRGTEEKARRKEQQQHL